MTIEGAHVKNTETGSVVFSVDGHTLLTRGGDDTVKRNNYFLIIIWVTDSVLSFQFGTSALSKSPLPAVQVSSLCIQPLMQFSARMKSTFLPVTARHLKEQKVNWCSFVEQTLNLWKKLKWNHRRWRWYGTRRSTRCETGRNQRGPETNFSLRSWQVLPTGKYQCFIRR